MADMGESRSGEDLPLADERERVVARSEHVRQVAHEHVEVAPTHIDVEEEPSAGTRAAARPEPGFPGDVGPEEFQRRSLAYHEFLAVRRARRFKASAVAVVGLTILAVLGLMVGALAPPALTTDTPTNLAAAGGAVLVVGLLLGWGCGRGHPAALALAWLLGAAAVVLALFFAPSYTGPAFPAAPALIAGTLGLMAALGIAVLAACTLGFASWRGERMQRRILTYPHIAGSDGGRGIA
jgi:hypothetical protein